MDAVVPRSVDVLPYGSRTATLTEAPATGEPPAVTFVAIVALIEPQRGREYPARSVETAAAIADGGGGAVGGGADAADSTATVPDADEASVVALTLAAFIVTG